MDSLSQPSTTRAHPIAIVNTNSLFDSNSSSRIIFSRLYQSTHTEQDSIGERGGMSRTSMTLQTDCVRNHSNLAKQTNPNSGKKSQSVSLRPQRLADFRPNFTLFSCHSLQSCRVKLPSFSSQLEVFTVSATENRHVAKSPLFGTHTKITALYPGSGLNAR